MTPEEAERLRLVVAELGGSLSQLVKVLDWLPRLIGRGAKAEALSQVAGIRAAVELAACACADATQVKKEGDVHGPSDERTTH